MASELQYQIQATYTKNGVTKPIPLVNFSVTVAGDGVSQGTKAIGFSAAEAIPLSGIVSPGFAMFRNMDAAHAITIGYDASGFVPFTVIPPGEQVIVFLSSAPYAQASVAACLLDWFIVEA